MRTRQRLVMLLVVAGCAAAAAIFWLRRPDSIGIWQADDRLGYRHIPSAAGVHRDREFTVRYSIDARGCRVTRDPPSPSPELLILGDSLTFGHGVADDEPFPAVLAAQAWSGWKVRNCGVMGWSTGAALLAMEEALAGAIPPHAIVYAWISADLTRNYVRRSWLEAMEAYHRKIPHFELDGGKLRNLGVVGLEGAVADADLPRGIERDLTLALIDAMAGAAAGRQVPFLLVVLPEQRRRNDIDDLVVRHAAERRIPLVDLRDVDGPYYPADGHPRREWHRNIAAELAKRAAALGFPS